MLNCVQRVQICVKVKQSCKYLVSVAVSGKENKWNVTINNKEYLNDSYTNVTPKIISYIGRNLHNQKYHPLCLLKQRIVYHFYSKFVKRTGNPKFSVYDNLNPVVTVAQNFDSLLIPESHVSRRKSDCYYVNRECILRGHMTAHQAELIRMGLDNFLVIGDVYRRDEVDSSHFPVFHQADAVHLCNEGQLSQLAGSEVRVFEGGGTETEEKQAEHTVDAARIMEHHLKTTLLGLAHSLLGKELSYRWVPVYFPFTHPSWELEVQHSGRWLEVLGCGIMRHSILKSAGASDRIGWAFGLGLERLAMHLYSIPDIRLFWSKDSGFLSQFHVDDPSTPIHYKAISIYPQCINDISFWLPEEQAFCSNDFYEVARNIGDNIIEQIKFIDEFKHPKTQRKSHTYRIIYRHLEKTLTKEEVNIVHKMIEEKASQLLGIQIR